MLMQIILIKKVIFKNCALFTDCISKINNTQVDNAKDIDIVMPMYNVIEYSVNYSKTSGSLWQYCKNIPGETDNVEIMVPLKYLGNFRRILERPLINCEVNLAMTWSANSTN